MTEDRFKVLEEKIKKLENDNNRLERALTSLTEAFMILVEEEETMEDDIFPPGACGPGYLALT